MELETVVEKILKTFDAMTEASKAELMKAIGQLVQNYAEHCVANERYEMNY